VKTLKPNVKLLRAVMAKIESDPDHWDQTWWSSTIDHSKAATPCNTAYCFAGWAVKIDGCRWVKGWTGLLHARKDDPPDYVVNGAVDVSDRAQRILGLTGTQSTDLFAAHNTMDKLRRKVNALCDTKGDQV